MTLQEWYQEVISTIDPATVVGVDVQREERELPPSGLAVERELTGKRTITIQIDDHAA